MMIAALIPMFGLPLILMSGARIFLLKSWMANLASFAIVIAICARFSSSPFVSWSLIGALALILRGVDAFFQTKARAKLLEELPLVLDRVILSLKAGQPLRKALREIARELSPRVGKQIQEIADRLELSGSDEGLTPHACEIFHGFLRVESASTKAIDRVESWRHNVRLRDEFRQRSGQVTLQIRAQSVLTLFLFVPVFVWNLMSGGESAPFRAILAGSMYVIAQIWLHIFARRFKWTV